MIERSPEEAETVITLSFQRRHESPEMRAMLRRAIAELRLWRTLRSRVTSCSLRRGAPASEAARDRCPNTIHSDYVTDHRCVLPREHVGDCLFGKPAAQLLVIARDWRYSNEYVGNYFRGQYGVAAGESS